MLLRSVPVAVCVLLTVGVLLPGARADGDVPRVPDLIKALGDEEPLIRKRAAMALERLGKAARDAVPALQKALKDDDAAVRTAAESALKVIGVPATREELLARLKDKEQPAEARRAACAELAERFADDTGVRGTLESLLTDAAVKRDAARALEAMDQRKPAVSAEAEKQYERGLALVKERKLREAADAYRAALQSEPGHFAAHLALGRVLMQLGDPKGAEVSIRRAIELKPDSPEAHVALGGLMVVTGRMQEAEVEYRRALELKRDLVDAHVALAELNAQVHRFDEAMAGCREAIRIDPNHVRARYLLGQILRRLGRQEEALDAFRQVIAIQPDYAVGHCMLGQALKEQGKFAEALASLKRGHELGMKTEGWPYPSAQWVKEAERLIELDAKLPAVLQGKEKPKDAGEMMELARLCQRYRKRPAAAVRFWQEAFTTDPELTGDPKSGNRYEAACAAALVACGKSEDAAAIKDAERTRWRKQASTWLRLDLELWIKQRDTNRELVGLMMRNWLNDPDLAGVRDPAAINRLPEEERSNWLRLWADVDSLANKPKP
jgi:tetratricopeptide (TPR) repeat protein